MNMLLVPGWFEILWTVVLPSNSLLATPMTDSPGQGSFVDAKQSYSCFLACLPIFPISFSTIFLVSIS